MGLFFPRRHATCDPEPPSSPHIAGTSTNHTHARPRHHPRPRLGDVPRQLPRARDRVVRGRRGTRQGSRRWRRALRRPTPRAWQAAGPRADRAPLGPRLGVPRAGPPGGMGNRVPRRGRFHPRHRRRGGHRVPHLGERPDGAGRRDEPLLVPERRTRRRHRAPEPSALDQPGRVGRRGPPGPGRAVHPRWTGLPRPHPAVGGRACPPSRSSSATRPRGAHTCRA